MPLQVLVVENNPVVLKAISTIIAQEADAQVTTAGDGLQALEIMKTQNPDIVFTDLVMPLVDGEMLSRIIRHNESLRDTFIVIVSAIPYEQAQRIADEIQCDLCIVKGELKEMREHIRTALQFYHNRHANQQKILVSKKIETDEKKSEASFAEEILLEKKHREEIVAYLSEGVIELSDKGTIVEINQAALDIFEQEKEQVIGASLESLGWGEADEEICEWLKTSLKGRQKSRLEFSEYRPIFREQKVLTSSLLAIEGISYFGICIVKDITRLYRAEEYRQKLDSSLRLVKKLEAMSGMAGGVAHDFNNLLTILCGNIDMVSTSLEPNSDDKINYLLDQAKTSAQGAIELARKISAFSPYGIIHRETCDTAKYLYDGVTSYSSDDTVTMAERNDVLPDIPINIDTELMIKALHNVFDNSVEAGSSGNIIVHYEKLTLSEPSVDTSHYVPAGNYAKIVVSDHGTGIAKSNLVAVFDPYFSTKTRGNEKGLGLGLAVVYSTLRNHGGYVTIDSVLDRGTSVSFFLPVANSEIGPLAGAGDVNFNRFVVVIDEDEQSRQVCSVLLEYLGFGVIAAAEGGEIVHGLEQHIEKKHHIVAALVNVSGENPDGGIETCAKIHGILPDIQVIATCSSPAAPVMTNARAYGFYNALPKPYALDDLRNILSLAGSAL